MKNNDLILMRIKEQLDMFEGNIDEITVDIKLTEENKESNNPKLYLTISE